MNNWIISELERRARENVNDFVAKLCILAKEVIKIGSNHQKRVVQIMPEFDLHDETHLGKVLDNISLLIGEEKIKMLSDVELFLLVCAAYLHDCGMAPSEWELKLLSLTEGFGQLKECEDSLCNDGKSPYSYSEAEHYVIANANEIYGNYAGDVQNWAFSENSEEELVGSLASLLREYQEFRNGYISALKQCESLSNFQKQNKAIKVDFIRTKHHVCAKRYIINAKPFFLKTVDEAWMKKLVNDLADICQSHGENIDFVQSLSCNAVYCPSEHANIQFIAMMLRMGDICHYSSDRAPLILRNAKCFQSDFSYKEWSVKDASVSYAINNGTISYYAYCDTPDKYYRLQEYIDWIDGEINSLCSLQRSWEKLYQLSIKDVDRSGINHDDASFRPVRGKQFTLQQNKIIQLLMGVGLYKDPYASLRELYQNAMDACRCKICRMKAMGIEYKGNIEFGLQKKGTHTYLYCQDNGTGMTEDVIEKYLLRIGNSYYKSSDFYREQTSWGSEFTPTSQFGIGILSCFMIASRIEIITKTDNSKTCLACCIEGPQEYFYYRKPSVSEEEEIQTSGTIVRLLLKDDFSKELNNEPIEKLGLVMQYKRDRNFGENYAHYEDLYNVWDNHLYNKLNDFINKTPDNIDVFCRINTGECILIYNKPLAVKIGQMGITDEDKDFIDRVISHKMFYVDKLTLSGVQDYLIPYYIHLSVDGVEFDSVISMPLPGMPETEDDRSLFHLLKINGTDISVDGVAVKGHQYGSENMYYELLTRNGSVNFVGHNKPQLSVDRREIIKFPSALENLYKRIAIEEIKKVITIAKQHIDKYNLSGNNTVINLIWKYIFDRMHYADVLFVNYISNSDLGSFCWPRLSNVLNKNMTINDFMKAEQITIDNYNYNGFDLLTKKLVMSKIFAAEDITIDRNNKVELRGKHTTSLPESDRRFHEDKYLIPISDKCDCFKEYDLVSNLYPLVPSRLTKNLQRYESIHENVEIKNSKAVSVRNYSNCYVAFFSQDARLIHPKLGLYYPNNSFGRNQESYIYTFENKRAPLQFFDFGYDRYSDKKGMMFLAYIAPHELSEKDIIKLEEYKDSEPDYYKGVKEGWTILTTAMEMDNIVILPGKRTRKEMVDSLSSEFWKEYKDFEFRFLDDTIVEPSDINECLYKN